MNFRNGILLAAVLCFSGNAFALDRCEAEFRRGLLEMKSSFDRLSPACQKEVDLGDSNQGNIIDKCSFDELGLAQEMQSIENSRLKPLCGDDSCTRLKDRGVCVDGKPFTFYLKKFDL